MYKLYMYIAIATSQQINTPCRLECLRVTQVASYNADFKIHLEMHLGITRGASYDQHEFKIGDIDAYRGVLQ